MPSAPPLAQSAEEATQPKQSEHTQASTLLPSMPIEPLTAQPPLTQEPTAEQPTIKDFSSLFDEHADEPDMPFDLGELEAQLSLVAQEANKMREEQPSQSQIPQTTHTIVDEASPDRPESPLFKDPDLYPQQEEKKIFISILKQRS